LPLRVARSSFAPRLAKIFKDHRATDQRSRSATSRQVSGPSVYALGAPLLAMRTRRPGSARPSLGTVHPPSVRARRTFTFIAPLGLVKIPMTRAHARLLSPCYKTGPESTQSYSAADGRVRGLSENTVASSRTAPDPALGPDFGWSVRTCDRSDANEFAAPRHNYTVGERNTLRSGDRGSERADARTGSTATLKPEPNGSRRSTGGEVHAFGRGRNGDGASGANADRHERHRLAAVIRDASESPRSTFRISQVYP